MASIFSLMQYLIKEYFIYVMALYTLLFLLAATLFVKYRANHRRNTHVEAAEIRVSRKPAASISGNKLVFNESKAVWPNGKEVIKALGKDSEVYIVTLVKSDEEEKEMKAALYADPEIKNIVKEHVLFFPRYFYRINSLIENDILLY